MHRYKCAFICVQRNSSAPHQLSTLLIWHAQSRLSDVY